MQDRWKMHIGITTIAVHLTILTTSFTGSNAAGKYAYVYLNSVQNTENFAHIFQFAALELSFTACLLQVSAPKAFPMPTTVEPIAANTIEKRCTDHTEKNAMVDPISITSWCCKNNAYTRCDRGNSCTNYEGTLPNKQKYYFYHYRKYPIDVILQSMHTIGVDLCCFHFTDQCPQSHPYAYYNGAYCCKYNQEKVWAPQGQECDGGPISITSLCCKGDAGTKCGSGNSCTNHEGMLVNKQK